MVIRCEGDFKNEHAVIDQVVAFHHVDPYFVLIKDHIYDWRPQISRIVKKKCQKSPWIIKSQIDSCALHEGLCHSSASTQRSRLFQKRLQKFPTSTHSNFERHIDRSDMFWRATTRERMATNISFLSGASLPFRRDRFLKFFAKFFFCAFL